MKNFVAIILISLLSAAVQAQNFPRCPAAASREELDNFCPRLEGVTLDRCCPNIAQTSPQQCSYVIVEKAGQAKLTDSNYITCQNNVNVLMPCCAISQSACYRDQVDLNFRGRLIAPPENENKCCFENCPPTSYWRAQPNPNPLITSRHTLGKGAPGTCIPQIILACRYGTTENCQPSAPCVQTNTGSGSGSGGGSGGGGSGGGGGGDGSGGTGTTSPTSPNPTPPPGGGGGSGAVPVGPG